MMEVWPNQHVRGLEDSILLRVKISVLTKFICRSNAIPIKNPADIFIEIDKLILKLTWKNEQPRKVKTMWKKKGENGGLIPPNFKS